MGIICPAHTLRVYVWVNKWVMMMMMVVVVGHG
jgi:hypothetical protein